MSKQHSCSDKNRCSGHEANDFDRLESAWAENRKRATASDPLWMSTSNGGKPWLEVQIHG